MLLRIFLAKILLTFFSIGNSFCFAYDIPEIKLEKQIADSKKSKSFVMKCDWSEANLFEQKIRSILKNEKVAPDSSVRVTTDKNYVFIAFYKGIPFFLDRYSIKVKKNLKNSKIWEQRIFPITSKLSSLNARSTHQKFCLLDGKFYNSTQRENELENVESEEDEEFLNECFRVGYYFAFNELLM